MRYRATSVAVLLIGAVAAGPPTRAEPGLQVPLTPQHGTITIRNYGMGILPLDGHFSRFQGVLHYDPGNHTQCSVTLNIDATSLSMETESLTSTVKGSDSLDVAEYPTLTYVGACNPAAGLSGLLTMHGVTHPFELTLDWNANAIVASGDLDRTLWNVTGHQLLGGRTERITVTVQLPNAATAPAR